MKITTIFDDATRPDTTGVYVREALKEAGHDVTHCNPALGDGVSLGQDLYLLVDDGVEYDVGDALHPMAYWAIDTHISMDTCVAKAKSADYVFAAQKSGATELSEKTGKDVKWLPLACHPSMHSGDIVDKFYDVCFVGTVNMTPIFDGRREFLEKVFKAYPNFYFGSRFFKECTEKYSQSKVVLNYGIKDDMNMRVFEALASGSTLLTNRVDGIDDMFEDGVHLHLFDTTEEAIEKVNLADTGEAGKAEVLANHTYRHRVDTILKEIVNGGYR